MGFVVENVALGQVFSEYFGFPCQLSFHQMFHTHLSSGAGTVGQLVADVLSGLSLTKLMSSVQIFRKSAVVYILFNSLIGAKIVFQKQLDAPVQIQAEAQFHIYS
jgi:hypothetical protein